MGLFHTNIAKFKTFLIDSNTENQLLHDIIHVLVHLKYTGCFSQCSSLFLKVDVSEEPVAVLVTAVLRQGSLTEGNVKQFEFRPSDILLVFNLFDDNC